MHKLHRVFVNPTIPSKYDLDLDRQLDHMSATYEKWFIQDQSIFTWLLSTLSESVLSRVLNCHHAHEIWDKIHTHYYATLKAKVRQLRSELKTTKKGNRSIAKYTLWIHALADSLIAIRETISDQELLDVVIDGLPEEYNTFVMMMHARPDKFL